MKRMTLLTALALVFSLFTVTAAIAAPGEGTGDAAQAGDTLMAKTHTNDVECQVTDGCPAGATVMTQTQEKEQVGECLAGNDCPAGDQTKEQTKEQTATQAKECQADDCAADEALMAKSQMRERLTERILAMLGAENPHAAGQYRLLVSFMLQNMFRFIPTFV